MPTTNDTNGKQLKKMRLAANVKQQLVADMLGVHVATLRRWEQGGKIPPKVSSEPRWFLTMSWLAKRTGQKAG